jgi:hypothetical protein
MELASLVDRIRESLHKATAGPVEDEARPDAAVYPMETFRSINRNTSRVE